MAVNGATLAVPECVDKALGDIVDELGWKKPRIHIESGSSAGDGYLSVLYRVVLKNKDDDDSDDMRLMCKTTMAAMEKVPFIQHVFKVESFMYNRVFPTMEEICHLKNPLPWPRGYPNELQPQPPCLVMEDLRPRGFAINKRGKVLDDTHCRLFLSQIARFHGAGFALDKLRPDFIAELRENVENPTVMEELLKNFRVLSKATENAADFIKDRYPEGSPVYEDLKGRFATMLEDIFEYFQPDPEGGNAVVHGDCHINNVMFQRDESGAACGCRLIDFQTVRYGWPTPDILVILLTVTEKATRDEHWDEWMRLYHDGVQSTLRDAGIEDPDTVYSWDRFQVHLRRAAKMVVCMVPMLIYGFTEESAIKEIQDSVAILAGAQEVPSDAATPFNLKETPTLKRRFGDVVDNLVEWGLL